MLSCRAQVVTVIGVLVLAASVNAETQSTGTREQKPTALLRLCFRDAERGVAVVPDAVLLDGKPIFSRIDEAGRLDLPMESGDHMLQINARGYKQMDTKQTALIDSPPLNIITLDPQQKPAELQPANLSGHMKPDHGFVAGYVVDDEFGKPLEDVEVKVSDGSAKTKTESSGFFALAVPMTNAGPLPEDANQKFVKRTFIFSKIGYGSEERQNVLLLKENPKYWQVRLQLGGSTNVLNEEEHRGGLQQWIFGVPQEHDDSTSTTDDTSTTGTKH